tara:strand:+ start:1049 stop:1213 length:165 start_codon:yes stop_codon:yes gene_type:complete
VKWHHWTILGLGIWLVASPWILGFAKVNLAMWNVVVVGVIIGLLALWNMIPPEE